MIAEMNEWMPLLQQAVTDEFGSRPPTATLATVDDTGAPRARSVVCRRFDADAILFVSDARSDKNKQLRFNPLAEVVFYFAGIRIQFRLQGPIEITTDETVWRALSDSSRALFLWPASGKPRNPADEFAAAVAADTAMPATFDVLTLRPVRVERLDLRTHPHARRRWTVTGPGGHWPGIDINP